MEHIPTALDAAVENVGEVPGIVKTENRKSRSEKPDIDRRLVMLQLWASLSPAQCGESDHQKVWSANCEAQLQ